MRLPSRMLDLTFRLLSFVALFALPAIVAPVSPASAYEVWIADQSDTGKESGGFLYIYDGAQLAADPASAKPTVTLDLGGDINAFCQSATQKPVRRPHMIFFSKDQSHAILSFLSGQVLFLDATTRKPEACLSMGKNVHAAWPTPDQKMAIAANMAEKKFIRIWTDYAAHKFTFDPAKDVLDLAPFEGGERPDVAPICPITEQSSRYAFITLRGGGLLVADVTTTPMKIVKALDNVQIHPAGCGGMQIGATMYINSGGGWPVTPTAYDVYALHVGALPNALPVKLITSRDQKFADSHGMTVVGRYIWSADRAGNNIEIIDSLSNLSVGAVDLVGSFSDDPAPDLMDTAPDGTHVFVATRGPAPLTGNNKDVNNAKGSTPGVMVIHVAEGGRVGHVVGIARVTNKKDDKETADPHGIAVRK